MNPYENKVKMMQNYYYFKALLPCNYMKIRFKPSQSSPRILKQSNQMFYSQSRSSLSKKIVTDKQKTVIVTSEGILKKNKHKKNQSKESFDIFQRKCSTNIQRRNYIFSSDNLHKMQTDLNKKTFTSNEADRLKGFDETSVNKHFNIDDIKIKMPKIMLTYQSEPVQHYQYKKNLYLPTITDNLKYKKPRYDRENNWSKDILSKNKS